MLCEKDLVGAPKGWSKGQDECIAGFQGRGKGCLAFQKWLHLRMVA